MVENGTVMDMALIYLCIETMATLSYGSMMLLLFPDIRKPEQLKKAFAVLYIKMAVFNTLVVATYRQLGSLPLYPYVMVVLNITAAVLVIVLLALITGQPLVKIAVADIIAQVASLIPIEVPVMLYEKVTDYQVVYHMSGRFDYRILIIIVPAALLILLCSRILRRWFSRYGAYEFRHPRLFSALWLFQLFLTCANYTGDSARENRVLNYSILYAVILLVLYGIYVLYRRSREKAILRENRMLHTENKLLSEYYTSLQTQMDQMREFRHDFKNYMQVFDTVKMEQAGLSDVVRYGDELKQKFDSMKPVNYCEDVVINAILTNKANLCVQKGIRTEFDFHAYQACAVRGIDMVAVTANLLDNAIEGCERTGRKDGLVIRVACGLVAGALTLHVQNSTSLTDFDLKTYSTSKTDKTNHGIGLSSVQAIVDSYGGILDARVQEKTFDVLVQLPLAKEKKAEKLAEQQKEIA